MISGLKGSGVKDLTQYLMEQACASFDYAMNMLTFSKQTYARVLYMYACMCLCNKALSKW